MIVVNCLIHSELRGYIIPAFSTIYISPPFTGPIRIEIDNINVTNETMLNTENQILASYNNNTTNSDLFFYFNRLNLQDKYGSKTII